MIIEYLSLLNVQVFFIQFLLIGSKLTFHVQNHLKLILLLCLLTLNLKIGRGFSLGFIFFYLEENKNVFLQLKAKFKLQRYLNNLNIF